MSGSRECLKLSLKTISILRRTMAQFETVPAASIRTNQRPQRRLRFSLWFCPHSAHTWPHSKRF
jgi:hypothetical protein